MTLPTNIEFIHPFLLLTPLILFTINKFIVRFIKPRNKYNSLISVYIPSRIQTGVTDRTVTNKFKWSAIHWLVIILLTISLVQPVSITSIIKPNNISKDIFFVIDTSLGMAINDYLYNNQAVDRLTLLKAVLIDFVSKLDNNRVGLVTYADYSYEIAPLTFDKTFLRNTIKRIEISAAGRANNLSNALSFIEQNYHNYSSNPSIILLSQGANINSDKQLEDIIDTFKRRQIKIHTIGIGSSNNSTNSSFKIIYDPFDNYLLKSIADKTSASFYWVGESIDLNKILYVINESESSTADNTTIKHIKEFYRLPVIIALILILIWIRITITTDYYTLS